MHVRFPSVRHPHTFYDVFGVVTVAVAIMALVLAVRYGEVIRLEMAVFIAVVFLWAGWAIERILSETTERSRRQRQRDWPWK
ncbi:hypothetical protein C488_14000 [Natrinema pellirubrum DSM 15624]|uniref:Uncharacterized protein n=1 Tax=Natrinema pellirubrum (strain DSM 15624 / CIP 106293 / JCM 10476 / NCIMB 786 / 157) TaxID=797303 RepID=L0JJ67_NATP1|nr:hypothetical protein [Natrinema pellirubrum]AGB31585.1 hypothetical protein Natpe_1691 [Natrinema pellirubrum DSM 15624]ELY73156.1 hypothetical protein C488_14000 [Natrinema pellirubrum DSM 15624]